MEKKLYGIYEYIRDDDEITSNISNTKKIILELLKNDKQTLNYCNKKMNEERLEVEEAKIGNHFHEGMTKREILVNEISQYMYWQIIVDVSKKIKYQDTKAFENIKDVINLIDISKIGENQNITIEEVINHDFENMRQKEYIRKIL